MAVVDDGLVNVDVVFVVLGLSAPVTVSGWPTTPVFTRLLSPANARASNASSRSPEIGIVAALPPPVATPTPTD